ncbi:SDR family NAD(P)-dependent oxidoreductase [Hoeflea prorocentri]|uniref:SDR family NAD(P)-dependent oxidoreductase n=1 Tax=Hoeflea prorocentri TaxID=1922333 RepID=A0A9X3UED7_9HYPH|nr:SDR family NAD(P)-dependent oxidoreductase [Hoeflea prorocentri]MCY6379787.1 SDR family NAD(P)-dependent oxidoreductase [Hoeflea prorocentri]MDA5397587.1 SDR family NAD(P)-dependent oxidoreductase [Hoeflea prorocentri]
MGDRSLALVAGAGPGLGSALMRRFEVVGYHSVGLVRSPSAEAGILSCDLSDGEAVKAVLQPAIEQYGAPKLVVHNPAHLVISALADTSQADFETCWRAMALSAFNLAQAVMEPMAQAGEGTFIVSGATASLRGGSRFSAFASAKFALRGLTQSLAREFQPAGIHVVHVILDGIIDTPASRALHSLDPAKMMKTDDIAQAYLDLANQPRSTWSHELDLRPQSESF